jgi:ATP-dependent Clp protease ATP-binding subunit ClpA
VFERFTDEARQTVVQAQQEARELGHGHIGTEHLLLGLLAQGGSATGRVLTGHGLTRQSVVEALEAIVGGGDLDADALTSLGIDLGAVREKVEEAFGPGALDKRSRGRRGRTTSGHIPFTPRAKKVLELSLREALALKQHHIADGHIALGLLREGEGLAMKVIHDRGVDVDALRREIRATLTR